jgi:hypothetical protein
LSFNHLILLSIDSKSYGFLFFLTYVIGIIIMIIFYYKLFVYYFFIIIIHINETIALNNIYAYIDVHNLYKLNSLFDVYYIINIFYSFFQLFTFSFKMKLQLFVICVISVFCVSYATDTCYSSVKSVCSSTGKLKL